MIHGLVATAVLLLAPQPHAPALAEEPQLALVTVGRGLALWERFGHNAILVDDGDQAILYSYGVFDFAQEGFFANFLRGRMRYELAPFELGPDLARYQRDQRSLHLQPLKLAPGQALALAAALAAESDPERAGYDYDYFRRNCSTRVRDVLDAHAGGALRAATIGRARGHSFRSEALRTVAEVPWLALLMDLGLGAVADRPISVWDEMFLPDRLLEVLVATESSNSLSVGAGVDLADGILPAAPARPPSRWPLALLLGAALAAALWTARRWRWAPFLIRLGFALSGVIGCLLLALWLGTEHWAAGQNLNILLFSPAGLLLAVGRGRALLKLSLGLVLGSLLIERGLQLLPGFGQQNLVFFCFVVPIALTAVAVLWPARLPDQSPATDSGGARLR